MKLLQSALRYIKHGLAVIPIWPDKRKNPHLNSYMEYLERLPTSYEWERWAKQWPNANLAAITGYWLNYVCLDFDDFDSYQVWADGPGRGLVGQTWQVQTGRGYHIWFQVEDDPGQSRMYQYKNVEVLLRARGGYCIVPPSIHHSGVPYKTVHKVPPLTIKKVAWLFDGWKLKTPKNNPKPITKPLPATSMSNGLKIETLITIPKRSKRNARGAIQVFCPFTANHQRNDKKPSAWINIQQQRFGCNVCCPGGYLDPINVYAKLHHLSNKQAYKQLIEEGVIIPNE